MSVKILAIETSCDETAAAVIGEKERKPLILSNVVSSQIDIHNKYGGVVPEVAARAHIENILPVIEEALRNGKTKLENIDYIAVTKGPGLVGSLIVGLETAKALAISKEIPLVLVNHLEGHLYANFNNQTKMNFPIVSLIVSGGHTLLLYSKDHLSYEVVGSTKDDAAGEAFDKAAKILGLPYPGGPSIAKAAEKGDDSKYEFPIIDLTPAPYRNDRGFLEYPQASLDFSFSGLKTALLSKVKIQKEMTEEVVAGLAASFQKAIVDNIVKNAILAIGRYRPKTFVLSGGVAANKLLRKKLETEIRKKFPKTNFVVPPFNLCTDNAAMIGIAAYFRIKKEKFLEQEAVPEPNLKIV